MLSNNIKVKLPRHFYLLCISTFIVPLAQAQNSDSSQLPVLQGKAYRVDSNASPLSGEADEKASSIKLQGNASTIQTRLGRPLTGQTEGQTLNSGVNTNDARLPIDFARAFPSVDNNNGTPPRLHGGNNSDLGIIGEIETLQRPHIITHVFPASPAQEAGMVAGDILLSADGNEAIPRWIIGVPGTPVTIVWNHRGEIRTSVLIRREAGSVPMEDHYKQDYLRGVSGFMKQFGRGW